MMEFTAEMIAGFLGGEIVGNKEAKVHTVSSIEEGRAGSLSYLTNPKYEAYIYTTGASVVLVNRTFEPAQPLSATLIKVDDAGACVLKLLEMYNAAKPRRSGISPLASVCAEAQVGEGCYIGDFAVVEAGVKIGNGCQIYPQVYLGTGVSVGEGTILYPGVKDNQTRPVLRDCLFYALVGEGKLPLGFINHKHAVKVGFGFYQAGLDGIAQPVLGGLVNYLEWRQGLHSRQRSPGGAGGGKA